MSEQTVPQTRTIKARDLVGGMTVVNPRVREPLSVMYVLPGPDDTVRVQFRYVAGDRLYGVEDDVTIVEPCDLCEPPVDPDTVQAVDLIEQVLELTERRKQLLDADDIPAVEDVEQQLRMLNAELAAREQDADDPDDVGPIRPRDRACRDCGATTGLVMLPYGPLDPVEWVCADGCSAPRAGHCPKHGTYRGQGCPGCARIAGRHA